MNKALKNIARGTPFSYAGQRWIPLEHDAIRGRTLCLTEDIVELRAFDADNCNDWGKSSSRDYLNGPFLDNLTDTAGGAGAFLEVEVDLTADDGLKDYGTTKATIFLLSGDEYRRNRDVIPAASDWWWLRDAVSPSSSYSARDVSSDGALSGNYAYYGDYGLRPACYLDSDLLISSDESEADEAAKEAKNLAGSWAQSGYTMEQVAAALLAFARLLGEADDDE